jgi:hypothetical protein
MNSLLCELHINKAAIFFLKKIIHTPYKAHTFVCTLEWGAAFLLSNWPVVYVATAFQFSKSPLS